MCVGCHGEGGISQMENIPSLAAQPDLFIQWQLVFFRAGTRKNEQMQPIVEQLNNEDIRNLGAYFASLAPPKESKPDDNPDLSKKGAQAAVGRRCASCHTDTYAGTKGVARVAGQREEYLVKALREYKCDPAAPWPRWPMSLIPSARKKSRHWHITSRISSSDVARVKPTGRANARPATSAIELAQ
jgi:cytochrome c553